MNPRDLADAFGVYTQRRATDDRRITLLLQKHFGEVDISPKVLKAYLHGVYHGAMASYHEAVSLHAPITTSMHTMIGLLAVAQDTITDIEAMKVIQDVIDVYEKERQGQINRHTAVYAIAVEQKWGVPERIWLRGEEMADEDVRDIIQHAVLHNGHILITLRNYGYEGTRKIMEPGIGPASIPPKPEELAGGIESADLAQFFVDSAKRDYALLMEEAAKIMEPTATETVEEGMADFMAKFNIKGVSDGNAQPE